MTKPELTPDLIVTKGQAKQSGLCVVNDREKTHRQKYSV
jgi:hypothetical protein